MKVDFEFYKENVWLGCVSTKFKGADIYFRGKSINGYQHGVTKTGITV